MILGLWGKVRFHGRRMLHRIGRPWGRVGWRFQRGVLLQIPEGVSVYVFPGEDVSKQLLRGDFELGIRRLLQDVICPGMVFVDAGANLGLYTVIASRIVGPSGRVFAFEPSRREWTRAQRSVAANSLPNAEVYRVALTDRDRPLSLNVCEPHFGAYNSVGVVTHFYAAGHGSHVERVEGRSLDSVLAEKRVGRVDILKLDVEGAEELVLRGGRNLFLHPESPMIICELSDYTAEGVGSSATRVWDLLSSYGYRLYSIIRTDDGYRLGSCDRRARIDYEDVLALKPAHMYTLRRKVQFPEAPAQPPSAPDLDAHA